MVKSQSGWKLYSHKRNNQNCLFSNLCKSTAGIKTTVKRNEQIKYRKLNSNINTKNRLLFYLMCSELENKMLIQEYLTARRWTFLGLSFMKTLISN